MKKGIKDLILKFEPISNNSERLKLAWNCAWNGFKFPENPQYISDLGDLTNMNTLRWIKQKMEETEEGQMILHEKPRINEETLDFEKLKQMNQNTLGYGYYKYMHDRGFTPDERPITRYVPDLELAYVLQRYKETHDFFHVLLDYDSTVLDELAVKYFEGLHLRLPSSSIAALFGPFSLTLNEKMTLLTQYIPNIVENANTDAFLMGVYYEKRLEEDLNELRKRLKLTPITKYH